MATSLAAQLSQIAQTSKSTLDLKARKCAHSKSLLFEPQVAAGQSFQTIYDICLEGFEELVQLDRRFAEFHSTLFSPAAQEEDRVTMTAAENAKLSEVVESFLRLVGSRLRLMPGLISVEWLIRRFRIHEFNTGLVLTTFLPYHTTPVFVTLLSILPPRTIPHEFRFLDPYVRSLTAPPRAAIVQHTTCHQDLLLAISSYTIESCKARKDYPALVSFWGGVMAESVNGMLDRNRSGRKKIEAENDQALVIRLVPVLSECLMLKGSSGLQIASYMTVAILAAKGGLSDALLSAFMHQLLQGWTSETQQTGLVCLCIIAQHRSSKQLSGRMTKSLLKAEKLVPLLEEIAKKHRVDRLTIGLALSSLSRLEKKGDLRCLRFVQSVLQRQLLHIQQATIVYKALLVAASKINDKLDTDGFFRQELGCVLVSLSQAKGPVGIMVRAAIENAEINIEELELKLNTTMRPAARQKDAAVANGIEALEERESLDTALEKLSKQDLQSWSCLAQEPNDALVSLGQAFILAASNKAGVAKFDSCPLMSRETAPKDVFYFTFYLRVGCGPYPTLARAVALAQVQNRLKSEDCASRDFQALIPYALAALADPMQKVRRAAADLVTILAALYASSEAKRPHWGSDMYELMGGVEWAAPDTAASLLQTALLPALEECVMHEEHMAAALTTFLATSRTAERGHGLKRPSHKTRLSIIRFLGGHVLSTPLLAVKLRLLQALNPVQKMAGTERGQFLLPLVRWWASLTQKDAHRRASREGLDEAAVDKACVETVVANDKASPEVMFELIKSAEAAERPGLLKAIFVRFRKMWPTMRGNACFSIAQIMLQLSQTCAAGCSPAQKAVSIEAADLLRNVDLPTDVLVGFLISIQTFAKLLPCLPTSKRRRLSSEEQIDVVDEVVDEQNRAALNAALSSTTFILELVHESHPENHPELVHHLFAALSLLQQLRAMVGSELGYLQNLVLSSLLAMVPTFKNNALLTIDASVGHGDVLVKCIQKSTSPIVINTALLLVASLARTAPDVVLHSVMPIFTFMGNSVLRKSDDYSAHVVNQTIQEVIPPLIDTFKRNRRNLVASTSELLSSFVAAYEHMPPHRKLDLFVSLIQNLGPIEFMFALLGLFVDKYGATDKILSFLTHVVDKFSVEVQLQTLTKLLDLVADMTRPKPGLSATLLGKNDKGEPDLQRNALQMLTLLAHLLENRPLKRAMTQLGPRDDMEAAKARELYANLLENLLTLAGTVKTKKALYARCGDALSNLLDLLLIGEFIKSVETLLDRPNISLRQKVLRALEIRVDSEGQADAQSRAALLAFLPQLTAVVRESSDPSYKHTAVMCIDKIADKYGKKDMDAVAAAAATIAGDACLGRSDGRLRVMALLCLASMVDILQDGIVSVLPTAIPKALVYLEESLSGETPDVALHNAAYAFMTSLAQHLPYIMSGAYLDSLLICAAASAAADLDDEAKDHRLQCRYFLAKLVEPKVLFAGIKRNWGRTIEAGFMALQDYLGLLAAAIDRHPKSVVSKNVSSLAKILFEAMDFRRHHHATTNNFAHETNNTIAAVESSLYEVALKMIYKLSDTTFRPVFSELIEWAVSGLGLPSQELRGALLRQVTVYGFLATFFGNLKSIVTSYGTYVMEPAVEILQRNLRQNLPENILERELWDHVVRTLTNCFEHDQDGFWQAPAHFGLVAPALVQQFTGTAIGSEGSGQEPKLQNGVAHLTRAIVELAAAADSKDHHKELNTSLLKLLRNERAHVRLAVLRCQQALTERLGEEWLAALPEMLPYISELQDDDEEQVEQENRRWIVGIEKILGESLDSMLQ